MQGLLVDIAGVLLLHNWDLPIRGLQHYARHPWKRKANSADIRNELIASGIIRAFDDGTITVFNFYREMLRFFDIDPSAMPYQEFRKIWSLAQLKRNVPLISLLREIREHRHPKMAIASNIQELHWEAIVKNHDHYTGFLTLFDTFVLSYTLGASKPDLRFYLEGSFRLGIEMPALVLVDDKEENGKAFEAAGGRFVHYTEARHEEAERELRKIFNLPAKPEGRV